MLRGALEVDKSKATPRALEGRESFKHVSGDLCILNWILYNLSSKHIMQREFFCGNALEGETKVKNMS